MNGKITKSIRSVLTELYPLEEGNKKWLPIGSHAHEALKEIVNDKNIVNDLPYLVQFEKI